MFFRTLQQPLLSGTETEHVARHKIRRPVCIISVYAVADNAFTTPDKIPTSMSCFIRVQTISHFASTSCTFDVSAYCLELLIAPPVSSHSSFSNEASASMSSAPGSNTLSTDGFGASVFCFLLRLSARSRTGGCDVSVEVRISCTASRNRAMFLS